MCQQNLLAGREEQGGSPEGVSLVDQGRDFEPDFKISGKLLKVFKQRSDRVRWTLLEDQLCGLRETIA